MYFIDRFVVIAFFAAVFMLPQAMTTQAGSCLEDKRTIKLEGKAGVRLSELLCRADSDQKPLIRVQFLRLNQEAASVLLADGKAKWIDRLFGSPRVLENDVLEEYRTLLKRFGTRARIKDVQDVYTSLSLSSGTLQPGEYLELDYIEGKKGGSVEIITVPTQLELPLVEETLHILNKQTWPKNINLEYSGESSNGNSPISNITAWRYLNAEDLDQYAARLKRYNKLISSRSYKEKQEPKGVKFLKYLTANSWPETFLNASSSFASEDECIPLDFNTSYYRLMVDVVVIDNVSKTSQKIDRLVGRASDSKNLRRVPSTPVLTASKDVLLTQPILLSPSAKLVVPSRIILDFDHWTPDRTAKKASLRKYKKIKVGQPGKVFRFVLYSALKGKRKKGRDLFEIRKSRASFTPPKYPVVHDYAFGPEWSLSGLRLEGEDISFRKRPTNFIQLTAGYGVGSCPILYAWNTAIKDWERYGKIIHQAQNKANEETQTIVFDGWVDRFRISEEELELAHIDEVRAVIKLADGSLRTIGPDIRRLARRDDSYVRLLAGEETEIQFALPEEVAPQDVYETRLVVTGYYERYSELLVRRLLNHKAVQVKPIKSSLPQSFSQSPNRGEAGILIDAMIKQSSDNLVKE